MDVLRLKRLIDFEPHEDSWQELAAGQPMQGWHWQSAWWTHYGETNGGPGRELFTLVVRDGPRVVAIAPLMIDQSPARGRVVRFLGEEEVCTDYPTILCRAEDRGRAMAAIADFLVNDFREWDVMELAGVVSDDAAVSELVAHLGEFGNPKFSQEPAFRCWRIALPTTWDEYLAGLRKKNIRRRLRKLKREVVDPGRVVAHRVTDATQFDEAWETLVDLHQRRRQSLGQPGCFASARFAAFHRSVAHRLLDEGQLQLWWIELDGRPLAAEYNLCGRDITYTYQGGIEPDLLDQQPGHLAAIHTIGWAIAEGHRAYDFLRGDELYKAQLGAASTEMATVRVVRQRATSQIREAAYQAAGDLRNWLRRSWRSVRETVPGVYAS